MWASRSFPMSESRWGIDEDVLILQYANVRPGSYVHTHTDIVRVRIQDLGNEISETDLRYRVQKVSIAGYGNTIWPPLFLTAFARDIAIGVVK
jgi:hypothetical protein